MNEIGITWIIVEGLDKPFSMASTPVTCAHYDLFCDATGYVKPKAYFGKGKKPVVNVNVADALAFCEWLSKETGATIRLPGEAEWEFAAKGGIFSKGFAYSGSDSIDDVAWYFNNSNYKTHAVAQKLPNELGVYDMSGNVWEWCGTEGVLRGGSWYNKENMCSVDARSCTSTVERCTSMGFRVLAIR